MRRYSQDFDARRQRVDLRRGPDSSGEYDAGYFRPPYASGGNRGGLYGMDSHSGRRPDRVRDWWMGGPERGREAGEYDEAYREFHERSHPRFSPIGGMYPEMGGSYLQGRTPRPLRYDQWFSDWTRWF